MNYQDVLVNVRKTLTIREISDKTGISAATLKRIIKGERKLQKRTIIKLRSLKEPQAKGSIDTVTSNYFLAIAMADGRSCDVCKSVNGFVKNYTIGCYYKKTELHIEALATNQSSIAHSYVCSQCEPFFQKSIRLSYANIFQELIGIKAHQFKNQGLLAASLGLSEASLSNFYYGKTQWLPSTFVTRIHTCCALLFKNSDDSIIKDKLLRHLETYFESVGKGVYSMKRYKHQLDEHITCAVDLAIFKERLEPLFVVICLDNENSFDMRIVFAQFLVSKSQYLVLVSPIENTISHSFTDEIPKHIFEEDRSAEIILNNYVSIHELVLDYTQEIKMIRSEKNINDILSRQ